MQKIRLHRHGRKDLVVTGEHLATVTTGNGWA